MTTYSRLELLEALQRNAHDAGRCPSSNRWAAQHQHPSVESFRHHFGSWSAALRAAGLKREEGE